MPAKYREKRNILRVLCQVCRSLRIALLPILWERLEACTIHPTCDYQDDPRFPKLLNKELSDQIKIITATSPHLSIYVRIVNVAIEPQFAEASLRSLAQCLAFLPNLHTVQIICRTPGSMVQPKYMFAPKGTGDKRFHAFEQAFAGRSYPSVKRVSLPVEALSMFSCFPEVLDVHLNQKVFLGFSYFISAVARHCTKVESFGWHESAPEWRFAGVINALPNLRRVQCSALMESDRIMQLTELPNLAIFALDITDEELTKPEFDTMEAAKRMLSTVLNSNNARLELCFPSGLKTIMFDS